MNSTLQIIDSINLLPINEQLTIAEQICRNAKKQQRQVHSVLEQLETAAEKACLDYLSDSNLTVMTQLDGEPFYETR